MRSYRTTGWRSVRGEEHLLRQRCLRREPQNRARRYAAGLDEVTGLSYRRSVCRHQQTEVTRITDTDGDGRANNFETLSDAWASGITTSSRSIEARPGRQHRCALCLSESYRSKVLFRGWCVKLSRRRKTIPVCSGIRSPCGIGPNEHGVMFYAESQGRGTGRVR